MFYKALIEAFTLIIFLITKRNQFINLFNRMAEKDISQYNRGN